MSAEHQPLRKIFNEAVEIADAPQRAAFLAKACGVNTVLLHRIEELIQADADAGRFLGGVGDTIANDRRGIMGTTGPNPAFGHPLPEGEGIGDNSLSLRARVSLATRRAL